MVYGNEKELILLFCKPNYLLNLKDYLLICAVLITSVILSGCHNKNEQDKIKEVITSVQKSAENKDIKEILSHVSKNYRDPQGYDYAGIKDLLIVYFFRHPKISVFITNLTIVVSDSSARSTFQAVLSGGNKLESPRDVFPEALGAYRFDVTFSNESGIWKVISAKWNRFEN